MAKYRMQCDATLVFTVEASSEEEAIQKAEVVKLSFVEGVDVNAGDPELELRGYFNDAFDDTPEVLDIEH